MHESGRFRAALMFLLRCVRITTAARWSAVGVRSCLHCWLRAACSRFPPRPFGVVPTLRIFEQG